MRPLFRNKNTFFFSLFPGIMKHNLTVQIPFKSNSLDVAHNTGIQRENNGESILSNQLQTITTVNNCILFHLFLLCTLSGVLTKPY